MGCWEWMGVNLVLGVELMMVVVLGEMLGEVLVVVEKVGVGDNRMEWGLWSGRDRTDDSGTGCVMGRILRVYLSLRMGVRVSLGLVIALPLHLPMIVLPVGNLFCGGLAIRLLLCGSGLLVAMEVLLLRSSLISDRLAVLTGPLGDFLPNGGLLGNTGECGDEVVDHVTTRSGATDGPTKLMGSTVMIHRVDEVGRKATGICHIFNKVGLGVAVGGGCMRKHKNVESLLHGQVESQDVVRHNLDVARKVKP